MKTIAVTQMISVTRNPIMIVLIANRLTSIANMMKNAAYSMVRPSCVRVLARLDLHFQQVNLFLQKSAVFFGPV